MTSLASVRWADLVLLRNFDPTSTKAVAKFTTNFDLHLTIAADWRGHYDPDLASAEVAIEGNLMKPTSLINVVVMLLLRSQADC